jgi:hypothetical protein
MQFIDLSNIINTVFSQSPKPPCTYVLNFQKGKYFNVFHLLMNILIIGAKKLFGSDITPNKITETQFNRLKEYIESLGYIVKYKFNYKIENDNIIKDTVNIWFEPYMFISNCKGIKI